LADRIELPKPVKIPQEKIDYIPNQSAGKKDAELIIFGNLQTK
jgi:hypothetical protein